MMGSRGLRGYWEIEFLSTGSRRLQKPRPSHIRFAKRSYWKRQRKQARREAIEAALAEKLCADQPAAYGPAVSRTTIER